jgi:hypothetical protein
MKTYNVKIITKASRNEVQVIDDENIKIYITTVPEKGKANKQVKKLLSEEFKCSKAKIVIKFGEFSSNKIIEILN